jgi:predicted RNA binding protein YcfA (HicA-like mRNA interferase family)
MGRSMPKDFYPDLVKLLLAAGCERLPGGKGSHEKWRSPISSHTFIVPRSKSRHTANEVLKQAGLPKAF